MVRLIIKTHIEIPNDIPFEAYEQEILKWTYVPFEKLHKQLSGVQAKILKAQTYLSVPIATTFLVRCTEEDKEKIQYYLQMSHIVKEYSDEEYFKCFPGEKPPEPERVRKPWDQYFIEQALHVAERGTCSRARVGCVLVKENRVIATGYNGSPKGMPHCDDIGHLMKDGHCVRTNHAEENALLQCARLGISSEGATAYVTHEPCLYCTRQLNQAGIKRIVYVKPYPNDYNEYFIGDMDWQQYEGEIEHGTV